MKKKKKKKKTLLQRKIKMYKDAIKACEERKAKGLLVFDDDITFLKNRLKELLKQKQKGNK